MTKKHLRTLLPTLALGLLATPALAWTPVLDEATAQQVIDAGFGRKTTKPTFVTLDLGVNAGQLKTPVNVVLGEASCLSDWQNAPADLSGGSRMLSITASGQADPLYWEANRAFTEWRNISAAQAATAEARAARIPDNQLRIDIKVTGAPGEEARSAYRARLTSGETAINPARRSYVADWKKEENGLWTGTVVYYFNLLDAAGKQQFDPNGTVTLNFSNEQARCGFAVPINLASFH